jgi:hypothetical protein
VTITVRLRSPPAKLYTMLNKLPNKEYMLVI